MTAERAAALAHIGGNPEIKARLDIFVDLLARWQKVTNLVSANDLEYVWTRHIADSAQLLGYAPLARRWVDLGSGGGFPGMIIAIQLAETDGAQVHCVESDQRKCAFLRTAARATGAPAFIYSERLELFDPPTLPRVDAVTSRALAPWRRLVAFANLWLGRGAIGIFPCGRSAQTDIEIFSTGTDFQVKSFPSKFDPDARIVCVRSRSQATK